MRKRILSILLAICMVITLMPQAALAQGSTSEQPHTHCICGGDTDVGDHTSHADVTYQPWDGTSDIDYGDDNIAYVCLKNDVTIQKNLDITGGKTLYLCLNGKTFASDGTNKIVVKENSRFILCDCAGGGTIDGANSGWGGTGIYLYNSTMDMYGGKITGGYASGNGGGGAIALDDVNCVFNMYGGDISENKANRYGGAIFLNGTLQSKKGGTVNLYGGTIKNNRAQIGGAIYAVYGGTVNLFGGEISGNTATAYGGGAICLNHSGVLNMTGGKMQNNMANTDGGAVNLYASTFTFSGGTISNNYAGDYGGAIYLSISSTLTMTGGEICNNTAEAEGGAVHVYGKNSTFNLSSGKITGNKAVDGGAVYLNQENSTLNMSGGEISGNKATRNGGAVYMFRATSTLNLSGGTIKNNTAGSSGGAVYFNTTSDGKIQGILNISGNPVLKDNTVSDKANNIFLKTGKTLSIVEAMTDGASVVITTESTDYPVVFSNAYDTDYSGYFFADDPNAHVNYNSEKKLELADNTPIHTHIWSEDLSKNDTHHWHECTADGCDVTNDADKYGYAEHTYDQQVATDDYKAYDATCTAKATYYKSCICGAKGTETFESGEVNASNHTFGAWIDGVSATCKTTGTKGHKDCTDCKKHFDADGSEITDLTIPVDPANHEGTLGDWVKTDPDEHWKDYSCCSATVEEGTHVYDDDADTTCNTCGYTRTITPVHTHSWSEDWSKSDTHHWHECTAAGCGVTENSDKDGYDEHTASDWITDTAATSTTAGTKHKECTVCYYVLETRTIPATGGGGYIPTIQKPTIEAGEGVKVTLSADGTVATITVDDGYELADVVLNGVSKGKVTEVKGLKTGDKLVVTSSKKPAEPTEPTKEEILALLSEQKLVARSKLVTMKNGKKAVRITWYNQNGEMMDFDGVQIFRSTKRNSGYGTKPIFTSATGNYYNTAIKSGTKYYYKVRGFVIIDGQKYYTDYSLKAIRTVK